MQILPLLMLPAIFAVLLTGIMPAAAEEPYNPQLVEFYADCINNVIRKCEKDELLINSQSKYIRDYAIKISRKAAYCRDNKRRLIYEMITRDIGSNPNQVENYVNQRFLAYLQADTPSKSNN